MSFRIVEPGRFVKTDPLPEGVGALDANGVALFRAGDLGLVGVKERAVVLCDEAGLRVAVRRCRKGEESKSVLVHFVKRGETDTNRRRINLARAIKELCLVPGAVRGRYELTTKDNLIIIALANDKLGGEGAK